MTRSPTPRSSLARLSAGVAALGLCALLAGCQATPEGAANEGPVAGDQGEAPAGSQPKGPPGQSFLRLERGLVLWFDAHTPEDKGQPGRMAFFVARDSRGGLFLESLGFFEPGTSLRLVSHEGALWLFPMGEGRVNAASQIYHPVKTPGREVSLTLQGRRERARLLTHEDKGVDFRLWFVDGHGLCRLTLNIAGKEALRLERTGKSRWGSRPAPYPARTPDAAWKSVAEALRRLDVIGLRQLMTPRLWRRLLPPGEGLTLSEGPIDGKRRMRLIREVVPQLLEVELERKGSFEVQAGQAQASAILRTRIEGEFHQAPARLDLVKTKSGSETRWLWAGFRPIEAVRQGNDEDDPGTEPEPSAPQPPLKRGDQAPQRAGEEQSGRPQKARGESSGRPQKSRQQQSSRPQRSPDSGEAQSSQSKRRAPATE